MKHIAIPCLCIAMILSLAACDENKPTEQEQEGKEYSAHLESGDISMTEYEKRTLALMENTPPAMLDLSNEDSFTMEIPFETNSLKFTTDNDRIVKINEDGLVTPVSNGQCIIHTDADGIQFHTLVNVTGMNTTYNANDNYAAYTKDAFDAKTIKHDIEVYATSKCGFTVVNHLDSDEAANKKEYPFTFEYGHTGASVKNKLLTSMRIFRTKTSAKLPLCVRLTII